MSNRPAHTSPTKTGDDSNGIPPSDLGLVAPKQNGGGPLVSASEAPNSHLLAPNSGACSWPPLPFMRNFDDAAVLFEREKDPFYLAAFMIQCWLGELVVRGVAEYAENKTPRDRSLQTGAAWRLLREFFPKSLPSDATHSDHQPPVLHSASGEGGSTINHQLSYLLSCL